MSGIFPVIMCGGIGARLWPLSRRSRPKQFVNLVEDQSLFMATVKRICGIEGMERLVVVTGHGQAGWVAQQLDILDIDADILLEPEGRDSAAAVACACVHIESIDKDGIAVIVASDHYIPKSDHFQSDIAKTVLEADRGKIVTLGIQPTEPSTAYGYIMGDFSAGPMGRVIEFKEKPDIQTAQLFVEQGRLWNSGNFIAQAKVLIAELDRLAPDVIEPARLSIKESRLTSSGHELGPSFLNARRVPIDKSVMEKTERAAVLQTDLQWMDLGAWDAVHNILPKDGRSNSIIGDALTFDTDNCAIRVAEGQKAVVSSVSDLNIVVEDDVVMVSALDKSQEIKGVVDELKALNHALFDTPQDPKSLSEKATELTSWLHTAALPLWSSIGFDYDTQLWREELSPTGQPTNKSIRGRIQGRQNFVYCQAGNHGWNGPWQQLVSTSKNGSAKAFLRKDGLVRSLVSRDGEMENEQAFLYDQTFTLLGLAAQYGGAKPSHDIAKQAASLLTEVEQHYRRPFNSRHNAFFEEGHERQVSNPIMHLLEACLYWMEALDQQDDVYARWSQLAADLIDFATDTLINCEEGFIYEFFDETWRPKRPPGDNVLYPGHSFEWCWLLMKYDQLTSSNNNVQTAKNLFDTATFAIRPRTGAVVDEMTDQRRRTKGTARLWPQCEWLKAAAILCQHATEEDTDYYRSHIIRATNTLQRYLETPVRGLWYDTLKPDNSFDAEPSPASSFYHISSAITALNTFVAFEEQCAD